ncbi:MAG: sulfatase-like hydrolase/transferase [Anaerolineae bacterium]
MDLASSRIWQDVTNSTIVCEIRRYDRQTVVAFSAARRRPPVASAGCVPAAGCGRPGVAAASDGPARAAAASPRPNIVFILTDDQDGQPDMMDAMPNLYSLVAAQDMTFDSFFAPVPLCCPARAILLLGQYAHNSQMLHNLMPIGGFERFLELGLENTTIATALDAAGYSYGPGRQIPQRLSAAQPSACAMRAPT